MSMYHVSKHSIPGQVNSVDADGILRLFTDSVAAYVENHATSDARLLHDGGHGAGGGGETHNPATVNGVVCSRADFNAVTSVSQIDFTSHISDNNSNPVRPRGVTGGGTLQRSSNASRELSLIPQTTGVLISPNLDTWEDARQRNASQRGYEYAAPVWIDCELGRVAICRHELPEFRVWNYAHKFAKGSGRILRSELYTSCIQLGFLTNRSTFNGILARGNRLYWRERGGYLYLTSWRKLSQKLTRWQAKYEPDHVATNRPGQRRVQLDLTGSLKLAHALIYNGWIAVKSEKLGYLEISRWTLERLWGRNRRQLRNWEALVGIRTESRYAEHHDIHNPQIPAHATLCLDKGGTEFSTWQLSNRIYPADTTISNTKGQGRKVRSAANHAYNSINPADLKHGGELRVQRTGRLYFTDRSGKNGNVSPYKQIDKHLIKHGDIFQRQHYAYLTTRYGKHIYEYSFDGSQSRSALCERDRLGEQGVEFRLRRMQYRIGWAHRLGV